MPIMWHASSLAQTQLRVEQRRGSKIRWIPEIAITPCRQGNLEGFEKMLKLEYICIANGEGGEGPRLPPHFNDFESSTCFTS